MCPVPQGGDLLHIACPRAGRARLPAWMPSPPSCLTCREPSWPPGAGRLSPPVQAVLSSSGRLGRFWGFRTESPLSVHLRKRFQGPWREARPSWTGWCGGGSWREGHFPIFSLSFCTCLGSLSFYSAPRRVGGQPCLLSLHCPSAPDSRLLTGRWASPPAC